MNNLIEKIKGLSEDYFEEILDIRHHIHANPELSFKEHNTAAFIEETDLNKFAEDITLRGLCGPRCIREASHCNGRLRRMIELKLRRRLRRMCISQIACPNSENSFFAPKRLTARMY